MSPRAQKRKSTAGGPRYYRMPPIGGLIFILVLVLVMMYFLFKLG